MKYYLRAIIIAAVSLYTAYLIVPTIVFGNDPKNILIILGALLVVSLLIRPIFSLVLLPINLMTLGSVSLILNTLLMYGLTVYLPNFAILAFNFKGANINGFILPAYNFNHLATIILVGVIITFVQKVLHIIFQ